MVGVIRKIKMARDWLGHVLFFSTSRRCSTNLLPVSPIYIFLHSVQVMQWMTFVEMHLKCSVTLTDRLGPVPAKVRIVKPFVILVT